jgi:tripartite-type tricarboxylate transporter receptor subunit TctC
MTRWAFTIAILAVAFSGASASAGADTWPSRPVRIVNTFAPGGAADMLARLVADHLSRAFGQPFYVETRAGAAGAIGVMSVVHTPPDGYNFVITTVSLLVIGPLTNPKIGFHPQRDLTNVAYIAGSPIVFVVNAKSNVKTVKDFVALAKKSEKPLPYSSSGIGSNGQLTAEYFAKLADIRVEHVPYKGAAQGLTDLVGGHLVFSAQTLSSASALIRGGVLLPIAHTGNARLPDYPEVPTFRELGYSDLVSTNWFGLAGPTGLPNDIVDKMNSEVTKAVTSPDAAKRLIEDGMVTERLNAEAFGAFIDTEIARWHPVLKSAGFAAQ